MTVTQDREDRGAGVPEPQRPPNLGILLHRLFLILVDRLDEGLRQAGYTDIRPAHGNVFRFLREEGSRITELAERARLTKQTMGYLVDYLEERGYVERRPDPKDGRAKIVHLTDKGRESVHVAQQIIDRAEAQWAERLGEDRMEQLRGLLEDLNAVAKE